MSRKAKMPIALPKGVEVRVEERIVSIKGPKGVLSQSLVPSVQVSLEEGRLLLSPTSSVGKTSSMLGLYWSLLANMVTGVTTGFEKRLEMVGVGFRASVQGGVLDLQIARSHPTKMTIPPGIEVHVEKNTQISIKGINKQLVGQFAADVRAQRPPEPYKGKGIRYANEYIRRKAGKAGKAGKK